MFGWFKKYDAHLCSAVSGRLLDNGIPLVGIKIERELRYIDNKKRLDSTLTDEEGCFTLPAVNIRSKAPGWVFSEQFTMQLICINLQGVYYILWHGSLGGTDPVAAYERKLSQLNADLSNPEMLFTFINDNGPNSPHTASSICRWENDFKILHAIEN